MPLLKRDFIQGRMNKDSDIRLLPKGEYRDAFGVEIINSESDDMGAAEVMLSNKQLTNYDVGANPFDMGSFSDEFRKKIYWFVLSDTGSYLFEWDDVNQVQSLVLADTRPPETAVFKLDKDYLINGVVKVISQDVDGDLLIFTDDNMQPFCINIERAKTYGINGFEEEDVFLIKKPPRFAPSITPTYTNDGSNNLEEKFLLFSYRYRYLDGEYSAPSDFTNYFFTPQPFNLDYFTLDNLGMINSFNAVKIDFNTGEKQVTEIQLLVKESLSNTIYVVETFSKDILGWGHGQTKSFIFSNNKTLIPLPQDQLFRTFDNVPRLAKALSMVENIPVFSNYLEGYNIEDENGTPLSIEYNVSLKTDEIETGDEFTKDITDPTKVLVTNPDNAELLQGKQIIINIVTNIDTFPGYRNTFFLTLENDYQTLLEVFASNEFDVLLPAINASFQQNYNEEGQYSVPPNYVLQTSPEITYTTENGIPVFTATPVIFEDADNGNALVEVPITFTEETSFSIVNTINSGSVKTNRNYEVGIVYMDKYARRSTVLTSETNTIFNPQSNSIFQNKFLATINNKPPYWADRYKLVVKSTPLAYQTIYVNEFYSEDFYTWCKLESNNKDKVSVGDFLIVKKAGQNILTELIKIKVLDIKQQDKDFIPLNQDDANNDIIEREGLYMKIKPTTFSMDRDDFTVNERSFGDVGSSGFPVAFLDLFSDDSGASIEELPINAGDSISLFINSSRLFSFGWRNRRVEKTYFAQANYNSIEDWFNAVIISTGSLPAPELETEEEGNYLPNNIELVRGFHINENGGDAFSGFVPAFVYDAAGKLYLKITGLFSGQGSRSGYTRAKITVRSGTGVYVFETLPNRAETENFFETEQCFEIIDGNHQGTNGNHQDVLNGEPAVVEMDFFNCYTQGNGVESYRIRDDFNTNYLTVNTRPTSTSVEKYREIRRFADMTYGKPFVESTNINGLNEFNLSNANFKELDKQYGSIQKTLEREGDILVMQEEKTGYVLFGKDLLTSANGESILSKVPEILGKYVPYQGNNGVNIQPESVARDGNRIYWVNSRHGTPMRLSRDGISPINYGMSSYFRNLLIQNPTSRKIGAYDPYFKRYIVSIEDEIAKTLNAFCGNIIQKTITEPFTYILNLNFLTGETVLSFDISSGEVNIVASYDEIDYAENNVTGPVDITIPREDLTQTQIQVTVTPTTDVATIQATSTCPTGKSMKIISIVLADEGDIGTTIINKYKWGESSYYSENHLFENFEVSKFEVQEGLEGVANFPEDGSVVNIQSFKDTINTGVFNPDNGNKLGYLISSEEYTENDMITILSSATFLEPLPTSVIGLFYYATFNFARTNGNENLYLIWDYRDNPIVFPQNRWYRSAIHSGSVLGDGTFCGNINTEVFKVPDNNVLAVNDVLYTNNETSNYLPPGYYSISGSIILNPTTNITVVDVGANGVVLSISTETCDTPIGPGDPVGSYKTLFITPAVEREVSSACQLRCIIEVLVLESDLIDPNASNPIIDTSSAVQLYSSPGVALIPSLDVQNYPASPILPEVGYDGVLQAMPSKTVLLDAQGFVSGPELCGF